MNFSTTNIKIDSYMHFPVFLFFRIEYPKTMPKNFLLIISVIANLLIILILIYSFTHIILIFSNKIKFIPIIKIYTV